MKSTHPAWPRQFLALVQEIHPDYQLSRTIQGAFTECLRPHPQGGYFSHSTLKKGDQFYHCFAYMLAPFAKLTYLRNPFLAGARFDSNLTVARAFSRHLKNHRGPHSTHQRRAGTEDIVRNCTLLAETQLGPHYLQILEQVRPQLQQLLDHPFQIEALSLTDLADPHVPRPLPQLAEELAPYLPEIRRHLQA